MLSVNATETFRKRGVIEKKEDYQLASHMNEAKEKLKNRVDKASVWLNTNVTEREELLSFEKHL